MRPEQLRCEDRALVIQQLLTTHQHTHARPHTYHTLVTHSSTASHLCVTQTGRDDVADTNFLEWLRDTVYEAVKIAEKHESLKLRIREARANIEHRYQLASLQVCLCVWMSSGCAVFVWWLGGMWARAP